MNNGIGDWITRRALRSGHATALVDAASGRRITYYELEQRTNAVAAGLAALGVGKGERVAMLMDNSAEFVELLFGIAKAGAVAVPVNFRLAPAEVAYVVGDCGAKLLAVSPRWTGLAEMALLVDRHAVEAVITIGDALVGGEIPSSTFEALATGPGTPVTIEVAHEDLSVIMYTSGTTGLPKGAMLTHANMLWNAINLLTSGPGLSHSDVTIAVAPMFHIGALGLSVLPLLYVGGTVVVAEAFVPTETLDLIVSEQVTTQFMVPAMWAAITKVPDIERYRLDTLRYLLCGGAPCPLPVIEFFEKRGCTFMEGFGMTELSPAALFLDAEYVVSHSGSVGRPFMHVDARLVDDNDVDVPVGAVGELILRGPTVFAGYWNRPDATAETLRGGWMHSGDLGRADDDGFITLVDRKKDMIITGGENVYPIEVEQALYRHPAVADVAVIGIGDARWGETVLAVVAAEPDAAVTSEELIAYARANIAHFKAPRRVEFVPELPRNASGKLLKRLLREQFTGVGDAVTR